MDKEKLLYKSHSQKKNEIRTKISFYFQKNCTNESLTTGLWNRLYEAYVIIPPPPIYKIIIKKNEIRFVIKNIFRFKQ